MTTPADIIRDPKAMAAVALLLSRGYSSAVVARVMTITAEAVCDRQAQPDEDVLGVEA